MNPRERILAAALVVVLGLGGVGMAAKLLVVDRWQRLWSETEQADRRIVELRRRLVDARQATEKWGRITPIAHNPARGAEKFRDDLALLLDQHNLGKDVTIRALLPRPLKSGFTEVRLAIQAKGTLQEISGFMIDFYRRRYPARLDQVTLLVEDQGPGGRATAARARARGRAAGGAATPEPAPAAPAEPRFTANFSASALVLPQVALKIGGKREPVAQEAAPETQPPPESLGRLPRAVAEYAVIVDKNLFKEWAPAVEPAVVHAPPDNPGAPPPPPPAAGLVQRPNKELIHVGSLHGKLVVLIRDKDRLDLAPERVELNGTVDDGRLVLVYPRGMVVQVAEAAGGFKYYVYKLGTTFRDREELDPVGHAQLADELRRALQPPPALRTTGTSLNSGS